jgi:hypothetical protein
LVWFRAGQGQAGVDHHLEFRVPNELLCLLQRWKPAHTEVILDFSNLTVGGPLQGVVPDQTLFILGQSTLGGPDVLGPAGPAPFVLGKSKLDDGDVLK